VSVSKADRLERALEASWPAPDYAEAGAFRVGRAGADPALGAAALRSRDAAWQDEDLQRAFDLHASWQQPPIFRLADDADPALVAALTQRGLQPAREMRMLAVGIDRLTTQPVPRVTSFAVWPPLAIQRDLWAEMGLDAARQAIMDRVALPKSAILGRTDDRAAGVAFVAASDGLAVLHALEIVPSLRRQGLAGWMMREAGFWATAQGCDRLCLAVAADNAAAIALYRKLEFQDAGGFRYFAPPGTRL